MSRARSPDTEWLALRRTLAADTVARMCLGPFVLLPAGPLPINDARPPDSELQRGRAPHHARGPA